MIGPRRYFPWKIARHFFLNGLVFVVLTLVVTGFSLRYYVYTQFSRGEDLAVMLGAFDRYLTTLFFVVLSGAVVYLVLTTRFYFKPLGRLLQRAREMRRADAPVEEIDEDAVSEEPGEWMDLERSLNRVHRDLRQKTDQLSRDREELSALIGAVSDAILAVDNDGAPLFFNTQFAVLFGLSGKVRKDLRLPEILRVPEILEAYRTVLGKGVPLRINTSVHTGRSAIARHFSISVAPLRSAENEPVYGAVGIFHDVTELKQAEQIRIEFVGNASHELRTPLTSIKGYVDTLKEDVAHGRHDGAGPFLDIVSRNVDRLMFLVSDLLDLSAIESGAELQRTSVDPREVTEAVLRQLEGKRAAKRQEILTRFEAGAFSADARRVEQVLLNLVHNAIKYVPEGKRIEVIWEKGAGKETVLRVKDNGPGIPPEHQPRLFERFYRIDPGRSREQGGTGLGLAIVKHIMIKHGGSVSLSSQVGQGAEFVCRFPG